MTTPERKPATDAPPYYSLTRVQTSAELLRQSADMIAGSLKQCDDSRHVLDDAAERSKGRDESS